MQKKCRIVILFAALFAVIPGGGWFHPVQAEPQGNWLVETEGDQFQIFFGEGTNYPQFAVLHTNDSYFRMNYGPNSKWGTSIILMPALWSNGMYYQGAPVAVDWQFDGADLLLVLDGEIGGLDVSLTVRLNPPTTKGITAQVQAQALGAVSIDPMPGEAFKPFMLSSMHISPNLWDAQWAYVDCVKVALPTTGWIIEPPIQTTTFGLHGGTSDWKTNATTIEITLSDAMDVTGWVTVSNDPDDDNIGFWPVTDQVLPSWQYSIQARGLPSLPCLLEQLYLPLITNQ